MMFYYREDLFKKFGLTVPKTWDEFAQRPRPSTPQTRKAYLSTFSANDAGWFAGLAQQAGASWWGIDGDTWKVGRTTRPPRRSPTTGAAWSRRASSTTSRCTPPSGTRR